MLAQEEFERLPQTAFPGGAFTVEPYRHWLMSDATLDLPPRSEGIANPMWAYYGALEGMGLSLDELFALVGASAADGPMFGEAAIEILRPLRIGATYGVRGGITDVARKEGRRAGTFDIVTFRLELLDAEGAIAAVSTNSFIFPRRG